MPTTAPNQCSPISKTRASGSPARPILFSKRIPISPPLYSGTHSLSPDYEKATSRVLTLYTGCRLNNSTELLVDIEEAGGAALSTGFGLAGNTDLDIVRNPSLSKAPYLGRGMIPQSLRAQQR